MATLGIPQNTIEVLQKYNFNFQKKFGQNFLIDTHVLEKIIEESGITKDEFCFGDRTWNRHNDAVSLRECKRSGGGGD